MRALFAFPALLLAAPAMACGVVTTGDITVSDTWSRATIGTARPGVVYLTIRNDGAEDDVLTGVAAPVASKSMLHETVVTDGVASMPHVMAISVPAGKTVALAPGSFHAMLMDLAAPLVEGATLPVMLTFERAGDVAVEAEVLPLAASGPPEC